MIALHTFSSDILIGPIGRMEHQGLQEGVFGLHSRHAVFFLPVHASYVKTATASII